MISEILCFYVAIKEPIFIIYGVRQTFSYVNELNQLVTDAVDFMAFISFLAGAAAAAFLPAVFIAIIAFMPRGMVKKGRNLTCETCVISLV